MPDHLRIPSPLNFFLRSSGCLDAVILCPSITSRHSTKMDNRRIMQTPLHDSPGTWGSWFKNLQKIPMASPPTGVPNAGGLGKNCIFFDWSRSYSLDALPPKIYVHPPQWSAPMTVHWHRSMHYHQQHWRWSKIVDNNCGLDDVNNVGCCGSWFIT